MNGAIDSLLTLEVQDPTDFPPSSETPGLRELDDALRCSICGELYSAPVSLSCGHTFCSLCLRDNLSHKQECPTCRQAASESQIRKNIMMEDAVKAWNCARPLVLRWSKEEVSRKSRSSTPPRSSSAIFAHRSPKKKRKISHEDSDSDVVELVGSQLQKSRMNSNKPASATMQSKDLVDCPLCQKKVPMKSINQHIDAQCRSPTSSTSKGKQKSDWQKVFNGESSTSNRSKGKEKARAELEDAEPLPKVSYSVLSEKRIREMLRDHNLPTTGDKETLIFRHSRWVNLYNANLDGSPELRKSLERLRQELKKIENSRSNGTKSQIVSDVNAYQKANKTAFETLVEAARPKNTSNKTRSTSVAPNSSETEKSSSPPVVEVVEVLTVSAGE
ncbi:hypothetical protein C8Q75DRAFT_751625 [Abortiporus biennis]|nr:hypothetical protein C8Q75DRAFT_751625 [Abortiporus biennis]